MLSYFPTRSALSHGIGRISDTHLDVARNGIRRALKMEKGSSWWMRCFPDRPVTGKPSEVRMGKGKGFSLGFNKRLC
jgi:ribosomal protein L16/L10AE